VFYPFAPYRILSPSISIRVYKANHMVVMLCTHQPYIPQPRLYVEVKGMPNHTTNKIRIHTEKPLEVIKRFTSLNADEERYLDLAKCITPPNTDAYNDIYVERQSEISDDPTFWHTWNSNNWGTKWNTYENSLEWIDKSAGADDSYVHLEFQTAWSPPEKAIDAMFKIIQEEIDEYAMLIHYYLDEGYMYEGTSFYTLEGKNESCWEPTEKDENGYIISWSDKKINDYLSLEF